MSKESKHRREDKKKPMMSLKERRSKKHEKKCHKCEPGIEDKIRE